MEVTTQRASREIERAYGEVIRGRTRDFIQCEIADIRATRRRGAADVTIRFNVSPEGKVSQARTVMNSGGSRGLEACLISNLSQIQFPRPGENQVFVTYPFRFNRTPIGPARTRRATTYRRAPPRKHFAKKAKKTKKTVARRGAKKAPPKRSKNSAKGRAAAVPKKKISARKPAGTAKKIVKKPAKKPVKKPAKKSSAPAAVAR